ncbi:uncharacterized protein LOC128222392 [Mya arenaria]|uniref:uncharacterized protein LOC128222392 n=1 Tax=Mya arenaria TaxID=6604 RepID=UPI0022E84F45|nr:uncharacterized protein LOC128222392 [Mya arenaria]
MSILHGILLFGLIEICLSQRFQLRQLHFNQPRFQIRRNTGIFDADHVTLIDPRASFSGAHASASASTGLGISTINLNELLRLHHQSLLRQPARQIVQRRIAVPQTVQLPAAQPITSHLSSAHMPQQQFGGVQSPIIYGLDTPDPNTPDTPDLVYAPRSMMNDLHQVELLKNRAEADGVVFV